MVEMVIKEILGLSKHFCLRTVICIIIILRARSQDFLQHRDLLLHCALARSSSCILELYRPLVVQAALHILAEP